MPLKLYNTATRTVEPFVPLEAGKVGIYVCGLTPSAQAHIGHARSFLFFDVLRRYLKHLGFAVTYVQNVTDIDDRSIARAKETGENYHDIVMGYYGEFTAAMRTLGVLAPDEEPYATHFIAQIIVMIEGLMKAGYAYETKDGVYYRVAKFPRYGELANRKVDELESGARIEVDEFKADPLDFALWKFAKPGEPSWESPWGAGRPGWHIECSAMSRELLGEKFDIHGGGADLIFPHHENEIAQSEPLMTQPPPMANYWVHGGLLLFENKKMSKSLGNFEPLADLLQRYDPQAIRLLFLQTGYSKVMNFTEDSIEAATVTLNRIRVGYRRLYALKSVTPSDLLADVEAALDEDMNTAVALSKVLAAANAPDTPVNDLRIALDILGLSPDEGWLRENQATLRADLPQRLAELLGDSVPLNTASAEEAVERVIAARTQARIEKDWAASDRLRDVLAGVGVIVKDSKDGTTWTAAE